MATSIQLLRSATPRLRPDPNDLADGMPMINTAPEDPGLYFRLSDYSLIKIGPTYIGSVPPNDGATGETGNTIGEQWLDVSNPSELILKIWDGTLWQEISSGNNDIDTLTLTSPNGTKFNLSVANDGTLSTTPA